MTRLLTKAALRSDALKRRDAVGDRVRATFANRLAEVGVPLVLEGGAGEGRPVVSLFSRIGSEPNPMQLAMALQARGVPLALPVDWSHGTPLVYRRWIIDDPLAIGPLGIGEPMEMAPEVEPDILFLPLVAFDRRGNRLGYGAGNVDRTLGALRRRKRVLVIGVAYDVQEEPAIPTDPHDEPVDIVVTERTLIECTA